MLTLACRFAVDRSRCTSQACNHNRLTERLPSLAGGSNSPNEVDAYLRTDVLCYIRLAPASALRIASASMLGMPGMLGRGHQFGLGLGRREIFCGVADRVGDFF
jgi:hypothetical protein